MTPGDARSQAGAVMETIALIVTIVVAAVGATWVLSTPTIGGGGDDAKRLQWYNWATAQGLFS